MTAFPPELSSAANLRAHLGLGAAEEKFLSKHAAYRYRLAKIPKRRGGTRELTIPDARLKFLQRKLLPLLDAIYTPKRPVHGFVAGRDAVSNADSHQARPYLLNLDIQDFFGSIRKSRVHGMLTAIGLDDEVARLLCALCTTGTKLPQGSPTSPILANMVCYRLDGDLMRFAASHKLRYTRYADDISFSGYVQPQALFEGLIPHGGRVAPELLSPALRLIFIGNGFELHPGKIWFSGRKDRKEVTGLIVNEFTNIRRSFIRNLRASLYKIETLGLTSAEQEYKLKYGTKASLREILRGRLEWIAQVRGRRFEAYRTLAKRYNLLFPKHKAPIEPNHDEIIKSAVFVLEFADPGTGENFDQGTAFFLEGVGLVTAFHVLEKLSAGQSAVLYRPHQASKKFSATPHKFCKHRDLMILDHDVPTAEQVFFPPTTTPFKNKEAIVALGFPSFGPGDSLNERPGNVVGRTTKSGVKLVEVSATLGDGLSGGPIINDRDQVIAIVHKGGLTEPKQLGVDVSEIIKLASE